jgi:HEAT repeat protein
MAAAGFTGDVDAARCALGDEHHTMRELALGALDRMKQLTADELRAALGDGGASVRRRAVVLAARRADVDIARALDDSDATVAEAAAFAFGERVEVAAISDADLDRLAHMATAHREPLVREAAAAALGAIGDERGLPAILAACTDKPAVRRRAVLALAPFDGDQVEAAIEAALVDRDWQVRQAAEDLRRAER